jgi:uncharacterized protein DUF4232
VIRSLIALGAACGLALVAGSASGGRAATPSCRTAGLVVWIDTRGNGAAGSVFYWVELTNQSGHACSLAGYPGVSAVDLRGHQLGSTAGRSPSARRVVTLRNGANASAQLQIAQVLNYPRSVCRPVAAAGLRVYPPNETVSKVVPFPFDACSRSGPVYLHVTRTGAGKVAHGRRRSGSTASAVTTPQTAIAAPIQNAVEYAEPVGTEVPGIVVFASTVAPS